MLNVAIVLPAPADVSCVFRVDGVPNAVLGPVPMTGAGAAAGLGTYTTGEYSMLSICTVVDYAGARPDVSLCKDEPVSQIPPFGGWDVVDVVLDQAEPACPLVGDVYVGYEWVYDCDGPA